MSARFLLSRPNRRGRMILHRLYEQPHVSGPHHRPDAHSPHVASEVDRTDERDDLAREETRDLVTLDAE